MKRIVWLAIAVPCLIVLTPLYAVMGDWRGWKMVWDEAMERER